MWRTRIVSPTLVPWPRSSRMAMRSPSFEPAFRLLNLNQRVAAEGRFINPAEWEANGEPFDVLELEGQRCFGGLDLSSTRDLTALSLWFPDAGKLLAWHFVPKDTIAERVERDRVPYDRWAADGWIETTPGRATDRVAVARQIADIRQRYDVRGIAFDRWRFEDLGKLLSDEGIDLPMPGRHNVQNALAAIGVALELGDEGVEAARRIAGRGEGRRGEHRRQHGGGEKFSEHDCPSDVKNVPAKDVTERRKRA